MRRHQGEFLSGDSAVIGGSETAFRDVHKARSVRKWRRKTDIAMGRGGMMRARQWYQTDVDGAA